MDQADVLKLFMVMDNTYNGFAYDDDKLEIWEVLLRDVPFEMAQKNLHVYIKNPENKFPPHPGALAETMVERSGGPYIPNVAETRLILEEREREQGRILAIPMPDSFREELKQLVERNRSE